MPDTAFPSSQLLHPALRCTDSLDQAESMYQRNLSDGHRLGVVFQVACALAHAQLRGLQLVGVADERPFADAVLDRRNQLAGLVLTEAEQAPIRTQEVLTRIALGLFGAQSRVAGRGQARKAIRSLLISWEELFMEQAAAGQVSLILRVAPFLWGQRYRWHRVGMAAVHTREAGPAEVMAVDEPTYCWVVGGAAFRERTLSRAESFQQLSELLASDRVVELWRGRPLETESKASLAPSDLVDLGHWGAALARWRKAPPETLIEKLAMAECLFHLGRIEEAAQIVREVGAHRPDSKGKFSLRWTLMWAKCSQFLGQLSVASKALKQLATREADWSSLTTEERFDLIKLAIRASANLGDTEGLRAAKRMALRWKGKGKAFGHILASNACLDLDDLPGAVSHMEKSVIADPEIVDFWRYPIALSSVQFASQDARGGLQSLTLALGLHRRSMSVLDAGGLWSEMILAKAMLQDLAGAERASRHALRLIRKCDGSTGSTLILANYAEILIRRGRLQGVEQIVLRSAQDTALSGNRRKEALDFSLQARLHLARGRCPKAESLLRGCLDAMERLNWVEYCAETQLLLARTLAWLGRHAAARRALLAATHVALQSDDLSETGVDHRRLPKGVLEPEEIPALLLQVGEFAAARRAASGIESERLWHTLSAAGGRQRVSLSSRLVNQACRNLEPYRAGRLVFDALLCGGRMDNEVLMMASEELSNAGAPWLARGVAGAQDEGWAALADFLESGRLGGDGNGEVDLDEELRSLFLSLGVPGVRVELVTGTDSKTLVVGPGGEETLVMPVKMGELRFVCPAVNSQVRAAASAVTNVLDGGGSRRFDVQAERVSGAGETDLPAGVVGKSSSLVLAYSNLRRLANTDMPLLVLGETGTGKESAARAVHEASARRGKHFLPVNCAALDKHLALSDLFGHVKGAFTGADKDRRGVFESAAGGTVFLDEVGDLSLGAQGLLLRVLQEKEVRRLGESEARPVDVRIVAATHRSLEAQVREGTFREDLLYRLNTGEVTLPPLRDRGADVLLLAEHFLSQFGGAGFSEEARSSIARFPWPGNVRQLRSSVQRACALAGEQLIGSDHLGLPSAKPLAGWHEWLEDMKRSRLIEELERHDGNQSAAARSLGLTRQALSYLVRQLGLV